MRALLTLLIVLPLWLGVVVHGARDSKLSRVKRQSFQSDLVCDRADIILMLDASGSIGLDNWYKITNFTRNIVNAFNIGPDKVRIGVLSYGNLADIAFHLNTHRNRQSILAQMRDIPWKNQETNTSGAIRTMRTQMFIPERGDRLEVPNIGVVITDGESTRDVGMTIPEARTAKGEGITMLSVGIGDRISMDELIGIASSPQERFVFQATDFDALESIERAVQNAACAAAAECREDADVVFVLDSSGSVGDENFIKIKDFINAVIRDFDIDKGRMRVGALRFSDGVVPQFFMDDYTKRADILKAITRVDYIGGTTNTAGALKILREEMFKPGRGARQGTNKVAVVFTDGGSNNFDDTIKMAKEARMDGISILVVSIGNWVNWLEINEIASDPDANNVFKVEDFTRFGEIRTALRQAICSDHNYCNPNPCQNGGRCTNYIGQYICSCRDRWAGRNCQFRCETPVDVVLALDSSDSIGPNNYNLLLDFGKELARSLNVGESKTRIGFNTYATDAKVRIQMNRYYNPLDMSNAVSFPFMTGKTNTGGALKLMRTDMFQPQNGDRANVRNVGVVISDGHSTNRKHTYDEAMTFHSKVGALLAVGVGTMSDYDKQEMRTISSDPDDKNFLQTPSYDKLGELATQMVRAICLTDKACDSNPCQNAGRCVNIMNGFECECLQGYTGQLCERVGDGVLDLVFLIDASGSVRRERFPMVLEFVRNIVRNLEIRPRRTRVGVATYASTATVQFYLNTYERKEDVLQAIEFIQFQGGKTNTAAGINLLRTTMFLPQHGERDFAPNIALLVTDGSSNMNVQDTIPAAILARAQGIHLSVATVGRDNDMPEMNAIASDPDASNVFVVNKYQDLNSIVTDVIKATSNERNECYSNPCRNGGTCLDGIGMYTCRCRGDWIGIQCTKRCSRQNDIIFLFDASGSLASQLSLEVSLAKRIASSLNFASGRTRVGTVSFQADAKTRFYLNTFSTREDVVNSLDFVADSRIKGTNTAAALSGMLSMFTPDGGDRTGVPNTAIILTDGQSNINQENTIPEAQRAHRAGVHLLAVGVGTSVRRSEITGIASDPDASNTFYLQDDSQIAYVADRIIDELCR